MRRWTKTLPEELGAHPYLFIRLEGKSAGVVLVNTWKKPERSVPAEHLQGVEFLGMYSAEEILDAMRKAPPMQDKDAETELLLGAIRALLHEPGVDVIVEVSGGVVDNVYARDPLLKAETLDWDNVNHPTATAEDKAEGERLARIIREDMVKVG